MKMYDGVLQRVKQVEEKHGIKYATTDGMLYKTLSILLIIALIYTIGINLLCVAGAALKISSLYSGTVATIDGKSYNEVEYWEYQGLDAKKMEMETQDRSILSFHYVFPSYILALLKYKCKI